MCGEPIIDILKLPEHIRKQIYKPSAEEASRGKLTLNFESPVAGFQGGKDDSVEIEA